MAKINEYDATEKLAILQDYATEKVTRAEVARKYNISVSTLKKWRYQYERDGLEIRTRNNSYSAELKNGRPAYIHVVCNILHS